MTGQMTIFDMGVERPSHWEIDIDNDIQMLRCESCGGRVIRKWYDLAVGNKGYKHCPYCGKEMSNDAKMIVPWPGYKESGNHPGKWTPIKRGERGYSVSDFRCNVCGAACRCNSLTDFCPNCGTWMREGVTRWPERGMP